MRTPLKMLCRHLWLAGELSSRDRRLVKCLMIPCCCSVAAWASSMARLARQREAELMTSLEEEL